MFFLFIQKRWKAILSEEYPTLIFYANMTKPLGKVALMSLLRQLALFHRKDRQQISVGIIGYPNVGKSSIINALRFVCLEIFGFLQILLHLISFV